MQLKVAQTIACRKGFLMTEFTPTTAAATRQETLAGDVCERLRQRLDERLQHFRQGGVTPAAAFALEQELKTLLDAAGRDLLQQEFNRLEAADKTQAAPRLRYQRATYRINKRTKAEVASSFGRLTLWSFLYLHPD